MRIVLLSSTFNGLTQRAYAELAEDGHTVSVCIAADDAEIRARVHDAKPDLILCPMLTRPVPAEIWRRFTTLIVHPGIPGDRGPSALDWAILRGLETWGVTVLQADAAMDAGPIWSRATFPMRPATKSSIYRREVTDTAMACLRDAVGKAQDPHFRPQPLAEVDSSVAGQWNDAMRQTDRAISWTTDSTACVCRKIRSADGHPGVLDTVRGVRCYLYGAHPADGLRGTPGEVLGVRGGAICIATTDGAVWITHVRRKADKPTDTFKLPATTALADVLADAPVLGRDVAAPCHAEGPRATAA